MTLIDYIYRLQHIYLYCKYFCGKIDISSDRDSSVGGRFAIVKQVD